MKARITARSTAKTTDAERLDGIERQLRQVRAELENLAEFENSPQNSSKTVCTHPPLTEQTS